MAFYTLRKDFSCVCALLNSNKELTDFFNEHYRCGFIVNFSLCPFLSSNRPTEKPMKIHY